MRPDPVSTSRGEEVIPTPLITPPLDDDGQPDEDTRGRIPLKKHSYAKFEDVKDEFLRAGWTKEDYDNLNERLEKSRQIEEAKRIEELRQKESKSQKQKRFPAAEVYGLFPGIRHFRGSDTDRILGPDDDFVVRDYPYPPHPEVPQSDKFFDDEFDGVYSVVAEFVIDHFGRFDIKPTKDAWLNPWKEVKVTPLFISLVELVEDVDPDKWGWDSLLYNADKRIKMMVGMIARIFSDKVFKSLLFGCTSTQLDMLNGLERTLAEDYPHDGFPRTKIRSQTVRNILDGDVFTKNFRERVEQLTYDVFEFLEPISVYLQKYADCHPKEKLSLPPRSARFTFLYKTITAAAWLSICVRLHPDPIMIRLSMPGDEFDPEVDECVNFDEYCERKKQILHAQYDVSGVELGKIVLDEIQAEKAASEEYDSILAESQLESELVADDTNPPNTGSEEERAQYIEKGKGKFYKWTGKDLPEKEVFKGRESLVKTAIWPSFKIYSPWDGEKGGKQKGMSVYTIQKSQIFAHWVVPRRDRAPTMSLEEWVKFDPSTSDDAGVLAKRA